jgi:serine/threonine protein kinase/tetratricopeptide (TPR) repeat protein
MANEPSGPKRVPPPPPTTTPAEPPERSRTQIAVGPAPGKPAVPPGVPVVPPAAKDPTPPPATPRQEARTRIAMGAVPAPIPAAKTPEPEPPAPEPLAVPPAQAARRPTDAEVADTTDFQRSRAVRPGTHIAGTEGLSVPGAEAPKLRLIAGKIVPTTRYRILRWLGEGGMGVVYEAEHADIERRVALKILRFDLSQEPRMVQVFRDEARAASRMGSPNIVDIYDFGELPDGRLFFCMELLEGRDLVPESENDWTEPAQLIATLRQICKGLHAAHQAGIVHRDVKPENIILVTRDGRQDVVKIVDFGISSMLAASHEEGGIAGTPHYMAPEQITSQSFDGRLDVYAVGCVAYELLAGHPPFDAEELEDLLHQHLADNPVPPSEVRPDREIPKELEAVIMRCLAKLPSNRYANMAELEAALCEAQIALDLYTAWDDLPMPDVDDERRERLLKEMPSPVGAVEHHKRRWVWPTVAGVSVAGAAAAVAFVLFGTKPTESERDVIEQLTIAARNAGAKANYVYPPPDDREEPTSYRKVVELEDIKGAAKDLADRRGEELRGEFSTTLVGFGDRMWDEGITSMARDYYIQALVFEPAHRHAFERSGLTQGQLADFLERTRSGEFSEMELIASRALAAAVADDEAARQQAEEAFSAGMADAELSINQGTVLRSLGRSAGIESAEPDAQEIPPPPVPIVDPFDESTEGTEGADGTGDEESAGKKRSSIRARDGAALLGSTKRNPKRARQLAERGLGALRSGRRSEAESLFNQAIAFDRKNGTALMGLSDIYFDTGANQKAVLYAERAVKASPKNRTYRLKLGDAYFKVLRYRDALQQYKEAKKLGEKRAEERITKVKAKLGN